MFAADTLAPAFLLSDQHREIVGSASLRDAWHVICFYPKDDRDARSCRDHLDRLRTMGMRMLGISFDSIASHRVFAEKYHLHFELLAGPDDKTHVRLRCCFARTGIRSPHQLYRR